MPAPDMHQYVRGLLGETLYTVAQNKPNTIVAIRGASAIVETETGHQSPVGLTALQAIADRVFAGEVVQVGLRGRTAFYLAVLATVPGVEYALDPRRVWLEGLVAINDEYDELFPDELFPDEATATEGREQYRTHRLLERNPSLARRKKAQVLAQSGRLRCEACGFDFADCYGDLGEGFIECHHRVPLHATGERETRLEDLALVCANCHRMLHRSQLQRSVEQLRDLLQLWRAKEQASPRAGPRLPWSG